MSVALTKYTEEHRMKADTRLFGEIEIEDEKIISFEQGIIGFSDLKHFALIFDTEKGQESRIKWLQSMDEPEFAVPVVAPNDIIGTYNPTVSDALLEALGKLTPENTYVLVSVTVPKEIEEISVNLKAPFIVNMDTKKACQLIVEDDYAVRYKIYDIIKNDKEKAGE